MGLRGILLGSLLTFGLAQPALQANSCTQLGSTIVVKQNFGGFQTFIHKTTYYFKPDPNDPMHQKYLADVWMDGEFLYTTSSQSARDAINGVCPGFLASGPSASVSAGAKSVPATPQPVVPAGQTNQLVAIADFNGDGFGDSAVLTTSGIVVALHKPADGSVLSTATYSVPGVGPSIVAVDFNGDGFVDIAVTQTDDSGQGNVVVLLGKGDGTFGPPTAFPAGPFAFYLTTGQFNSDGFADLAVTNSPTVIGTTSTVSVLLGKGDGTFLPPMSYPVGEFPGTIVAADFNGDGNTDLVALDSQAGIAIYTNKVWALLGKGDGTFRPAVSTVSGTGSGYLAWVDLNHDGNLDLVIADESASAMAVMLGNGDGTFQAATEYLMAAEVGSIAPLPLGDGSTLLLTSDNASSSEFLTFFESDGTTTIPVVQNLGASPTSIASSDLNGDHQPDLVITDAETGNIYVKLATGGGKFGNPATYSPGSHPGAVALADVNGDGDIDVLVADATGLDVLLGNGNGTLQSVRTVPAGGSLSSVAIADFNLDGKPDVVAANAATGGISLFMNNGNGAFQSARTISLSSGLVALSAVTGDFDGDGKPDLIVAFSPTDNNQPGGVAVLLGKGDGTFQPPVNITLPGPVVQQAVGSASSVALAVADLNGDGKLDVVTAIHGATSNQIAVLLGIGNGTFQTPLFTNTNTAPPMIVITDQNGDGIPDLVLADCCGLSEASVLFGNGDGTFQKELQFPSGSNPSGIAAADFNGDGKPDLAIIGQVQTPDRGTLAIVLNTSSSGGTTTTTTASSASTTFSPNAQNITLSATVTSNSVPVSGGTVTFTLLNTTASANVNNGTASVSFTIPANTAAGPYALQAAYNPASGFASSSDTKQLTIVQATPMITWPAPASIVSGTVLGSTQLNATANVPGAFAYTPPSGTVLPVGNGQTLSVLFTPTDAVDYNTQTATVLIDVTSAGSIDVTASNANAVFSPSNQTVTLSATLTSNLGTVNAGTVSFSALGTSVSAPVSSGSASAVLTIPASTPANTYAIQAAYSDSGQFPAASDNTKTLTIGKATPVVTWANPASIVSGAALGSTQLNATANVPGTFTYTPPAGTVLAIGNGQTLSVLFTPTDAADYVTQTATVSISVTPAGSTSVTASGASAIFSISSQTVTLSAMVTSNLGTVNAGTITFTVLGASISAPVSAGSASAVLTIPANTSAGTYTIQAAYSGSGQFPAASDTSKSLTIGKAVPVLSWINPADITVGTALGLPQLNATTPVPGTFSYTPAAGTVLAVGKGQMLSVQFVPSDATEYITATATVLINVDPMALTGPAQLVVTRTLTRDAQNEVVVAVTLTNTGGATAQGTLITLAKIGQIKATVIPTAPVDIASGAAVVVKVIFPANAGNPATLTTLTLGGAYAGGSFNFTSRITLP